MLRVMRIATVVLAFLSATSFAASRDWRGVESALGRKGSVQPGDVYKFSFPRSDLHVTVDGVAIRPALALGSWLAFKKVGDHALVMGDLVLLEDEVGAVMERLVKGGIEVTALHNHLLRARSFPMYMHVMGEGDAAAMAKTLAAALKASNTPAAGTSGASAPPAIDLDTAALDRIVGRKGKANGGVYQFGIPRGETVALGGTVIPPSMGTGIAINFQPTGGGKAAITGDFVLTVKEVNPVARMLEENGIEVTALHNHMLAEQPRLFFMHFWANGNAEKLARGIRAALGLVNIELQ